MSPYEPIIGLEIHVQLKTKSKMFCRCSAETWNEPPNSHTCPVCLGLPGSLPVPNKDAIEKAIMVGITLNCQPQSESKFDRKNYFYPDLPKGFQISQYDLPFSTNGQVEIKTDSGKKRIGIGRAHLEEDTAKLIHAIVDGKKVSLIDFNRSGIPLMEIVSEPDLRSSAEAKSFAAKIQQIVRYLGVSDCDMEKGSLRVDANISLRKVGSKKLPSYKIEVKNMNSFRFVERALQFEIERQREILETGGQLENETRGWVEVKQKTVLQRTKEVAPDYRYFPEPDLPPFEISSQMTANLAKKIPELPDAKYQRFVEDYGLTNFQAEVLTEDAALAGFFEDTAAAFAQTKVKGIKAPILPSDAALVANFFVGEVLRRLKEAGEKIDQVKFVPAQLAELLYLQNKREITAFVAKMVFGEMFRTGLSPAKLISKKGIKKTGDLENTLVEVIAENSQAVADFTKGKSEAVSFLIGQVMRKTGGAADPAKTRQILIRKLTSN